MTTRLKRSVVAGTTAALGIALLGPTAAVWAAPAAPDSVAVPSTLPRWLSRATVPAPSLRTAGPASMTVRVYLTPNGGLDALKAEVAALSDPASPKYRQWLTSDQYAARYAPTTAQADRVSTYLRAHGLAVNGVETHRRYVTATGTPAALGAAFGTTLGSYSHDGQTVTAPSSAAELPSAVAGAVLTITGLNTTVTLKKHTSIAGDAPVAAPLAAPSAGDALAAPLAAPSTAAAAPAVPPPAGFRNARPCNLNYGVLDATALPPIAGQTLPYAPCGYTGPSYRAAYEGNSSLDGSGTTIAITDAYAWQNIFKDANRYASQNGDGSYAPGQFSQNLPASFRFQAQCDPSGWSGEETLDVEAAHAMAPGADIRYYGSASCFDTDFIDTLGRVVDENVAQVVTNSWSDLEENEGTDSVLAYEQVFLQGATQGQSFYFSSGDNGDELANSGIRQVDFPASDPYVTAAGGTSTAISRGRLTGQTGWGTHNWALSQTGKSWLDQGFLYGAGGGFSALFNRPAFQNGVVPASSPAGRAVPDVSMDADPNTGMLIGQTQAFPEGVHYDEYRIGGTSLASPLLAGMTALAVQSAGGGLGLLNPLFYSLETGITDVLPSGMPDPGVVRVNFDNGVDATGGTTPFARTFNQNSSLRTTRGWDTTTGIGVPNPAFFSAGKK